MINIKINIKTTNQTVNSFIYSTFNFKNENIEVETENVYFPSDRRGSLMQSLFQVQYDLKRFETLKLAW